MHQENSWDISGQKAMGYGSWLAKRAAGAAWKYGRKYLRKSWRKGSAAYMRRKYPALWKKRQAWRWHRSRPRRMWTRKGTISRNYGARVAAGVYKQKTRKYLPKKIRGLKTERQYVDQSLGLPSSMTAMQSFYHQDGSANDPVFIQIDLGTIGSTPLQETKDASGPREEDTMIILSDELRFCAQAAIFEPSETEATNGSRATNGPLCCRVILLELPKSSSFVSGTSNPIGWSNLFSAQSITSYRKPNRSLGQVFEGYKFLVDKTFILQPGTTRETFDWKLNIPKRRVKYNGSTNNAHEVEGATYHYIFVTDAYMGQNTTNFSASDMDAYQAGGYIGNRRVTWVNEDDYD